MAITFTRATVSEIPKLLEIENKLVGLKTYSPMLTEQEWREEINKSSVMIYLIVKNDLTTGNISYERLSDSRAQITGLAIDPNFQRQGIGKTALQHVLEELKEAKEIRLAVHPENTIALALYESLGFTKESRQENYYGDNEPRLILVKK